jgi:hypothetical protein
MRDREHIKARLLRMNNEEGYEMVELRNVEPRIPNESLTS